MPQDRGEETSVCTSKSGIFEDWNKKGMVGREVVREGVTIDWIDISYIFMINMMMFSSVLLQQDLLRIEKKRHDGRKVHAWSCNYRHFLYDDDERITLLSIREMRTRHTYLWIHWHWSKCICIFDHIAIYLDIYA